MMRTITNDEILFTCVMRLDNPSKLSLYKQSYSDGTCFYMLQDERKNWSIDHGSNNIDALIEQMEHELNIEKEMKELEYVRNNPKVASVYAEVIRWRQEIIEKLKMVKAA